MRKFAKHTQDAVCPGCLDRLSDAHRYLQDWFNFQKKKFPTMHVSWAHRDKENQTRAFEDGMSGLPWPESKHNKLPAEALDIFELDKNGVALFNPIFCAKLNADSIQCGYTLRWGGSFKSIGDSGHFEMKEISKKV